MKMIQDENPNYKFNLFAGGEWFGSLEMTFLWRLLMKRFFLVDKFPLRKTKSKSPDGRKKGKMFLWFMSPEKKRDKN